MSITLAEALDITRTGDLWIFRGRSPADRAIRLGTNSPVNHVGMTVALEDLPPLLWHAELGRSLPDLWSGDRHRGVQLHDARDAVMLWANRYGQHAWLRQLDAPVTQDDAIALEGRDVGRVGTAVVSPAHGPIALAVIRREAAPGALVQVGGTGVGGQVVDLPF